MGGWINGTNAIYEYAATAVAPTISFISQEDKLKPISLILVDIKIVVGPSAPPIIPIDEASNNPKSKKGVKLISKAPIKAAKTPTCAAAPSNNVFGFDKTGSKSVRAPIPKNINNGSTSSASVSITESGTWKFQCVVSDGVTSVTSQTSTLTLNDKTGCLLNEPYTYANPFTGENEEFVVDNYDAQNNISGTCSFTDCNGMTGWYEENFYDGGNSPACLNGFCAYITDICGNCANPNDSVLPTNGDSLGSGTFTPRALPAESEITTPPKQATKSLAFQVN